MDAKEIARFAGRVNRTVVWAVRAKMPNLTETYLMRDPDEGYVIAMGKLEALLLVLTSDAPSTQVYRDEYRAYMGT